MAGESETRGVDLMDGRSWTNETVETKLALAVSSSSTAAAAAATAVLVAQAETGALRVLLRSIALAQTRTARRR